MVNHGLEQQSWGDTLWIVTITLDIMVQTLTDEGSELYNKTLDQISNDNQKITASINSKLKSKLILES